jgi:Flp pilus assembly protein protease CpaA
LLYIALVDTRRFIIPAQALLMLAIIILTSRYLEIGIGGPITALQSALIISFFPILAVTVTRKADGLGAGDTLLFAIIGAAVGWRSAISILTVSSAGLLAWQYFRRSRGRLPFGGSLALTTSAWLLT